MRGFVEFRHTQLWFNSPCMLLPPASWAGNNLDLISQWVSDKVEAERFRLRDSPKHLSPEAKTFN